MDPHLHLLGHGGPNLTFYQVSPYLQSKEAAYRALELLIGLLEDGTGLGVQMVYTLGIQQGMGP